MCFSFVVDGVGSNALFNTEAKRVLAGSCGVLRTFF
jgi:hypothetical protein